MSSIAFSLIFYFALLFILFYKIKFFIKVPNNHYLSKENTGAIKGLCAVCIMMHHIVNEIKCGVAFLPFNLIGFLIVAVFFFYSGYGLIFSLNNKKDYIKSFGKKRMVRIIVPFLLATIIYYIYYFIFYGKIDILDFILQFVGETPVVRNSWFIIVLIYLYMIFWGCFLFIKNPKISWMFFCMSLLFISFNSYFPYWSPTIIAFLFGAVFAKYQAVFDWIIIKYRDFILVLSGIIFVVIMGVRYYIFDDMKNWIDVLCSLIFVIFVLAISTKVHISNKILNFIRYISFEIYLYHGLLMLIFNEISVIHSNYQYYIVSVIAFTLIFSYIAFKIKNCFFKIDKIS